MKRQLKQSGRSMRHHYRTVNAAFSGYETREDTADGVALTYPATGGWETSLDRLRHDFEQRYPAVHVAIDTQPDGRIRLELGGSKGAKDFVESTIALAQAGQLKLPSRLKVAYRLAYRRATSRLRLMPSFLIIGAPRCGTTSLYTYLCQHPQVLGAAQKEIGYFDISYNRGLGFYRSLFPLAMRSGRDGIESITGEATPTYLAHPLVAERVRTSLPNVKLIVMIRNPVERAFSQYHWGIRHGAEDLSFEDAIDREEERLAGEFERLATDEGYVSVESLYHSYLTTGIYVDHLERWAAIFPREQLHVVCLEAFAADPSSEFRRICEFLELPPFELARFATMNAFPYPDIDVRIRSRLEAHFRPHNERLWRFLGVDYGWNRPRTASSGGGAVDASTSPHSRSSGA